MKLFFLIGEYSTVSAAATGIIPPSPMPEMNRLNPKMKGVGAMALTIMHSENRVIQATNSGLRP